MDVLCWALLAWSNDVTCSMVVRSRYPSTRKFFSPRILASNLVQTAHVEVLTNDGSCSSVIQWSHDSDWYSFSYSFCHRLKVATETCRLFFLSAMEESLELVIALDCFCSHASSFTIARTHCTYILATMWQLLPHLPFNHTLDCTSWKAGHCVSSLVELFGPWQARLGIWPMTDCYSPLC